MEFDRAYADEQLRRSHQPFRRFIKGFYLRNVLRDVRGPCIDFGCGAGQLLEKLSPGSKGLELNPFLVESLTKIGLFVNQANGIENDFELIEFEEGKFKTLVISHVLEHLAEPAKALRVLFSACHRLGITRVIVIVPGKKGYQSDKTHKTFIDQNYIETNLSNSYDGFVRSSISFFPGPWEWIGRYYIFHEMKVIFDRKIF
jgi:SAM-dependent methyltransferase